MLLEIRMRCNKTNEYAISTRYGLISITVSIDGVKRVSIKAKSGHKVNRTLFTGSDTFTHTLNTQAIDIARQIEEYLDGKRKIIDSRLDLSGYTPFQLKVWRCVMGIPYGETRSYKWVAEQIDKPKATRAVGHALARNPLPIIIPCHRVINFNGKTGGYGGRANMLEFKRELLALENRQKTA